MGESCGRLGSEEEVRRGEGGKKSRMEERSSGSRENDEEAILEEKEKRDGLVEGLKGMFLGLGVGGACVSFSLVWWVRKGKTATAHKGRKRKRMIWKKLCGKQKKLVEIPRSLEAREETERRCDHGGGDRDQREGKE